VEPPPLEILAKGALSQNQQLFKEGNAFAFTVGVFGAFSELIDMSNAMAAERAKRLPARSARLEEATLLTEAWIPTRVIAEEAAIALNATGRFHATVVSRYYQLPIQNRAPTKFGENWMVPIRDWYKLKTSVISYAESLDEGRADTVLEVGLGGPYSLIEEERLNNRGVVLMHVMIKLIDALTGDVVGRAHAYDNSVDNSATKAEKRSFAELLADDAQRFKEMVRRLGRRLVTKDLTKLGLLVK
jgi:hypothetical protein